MSDDKNLNKNKKDSEKLSTNAVAKVDEPKEIIAPAEIKNNEIIFTEEHVKLIKNSVAKDLTEVEFQLFMMMAKRSRLDPLLKQMSAIVFNKENKDRRSVSYITNIDGFRVIAGRTGHMGGSDAPAYDIDAKGYLKSCTVTVYRNDAGKGFSATAFFAEYNTGRNLWAKMPKTMIAKCAEALALRKAFPQDLSGIYTTEEMDQASEPKNVISGVLISKEQKDKITELLKQKARSVNDLRGYAKKKYNQEDLNELTFAQASEVINKISTLPNPKPIEDAEDEVVKEA